MNDCLSRRLGNTWQGFVNGWLPLYLVALAAMLLGLLVDVTAALASIFIITALFLAGLFSMFIVDLIICGVESLTPLPAPPSDSNQNMLLRAIDCPKAQEMLKDAKEKLAQAQEAYDNQVQMVAALQRKMQQAKAALNIALAATVACFFQPWLIPIVVASIVAAAVSLRNVAKKLAGELQVLTHLGIALQRARQAVSIAEVLVSEKCNSDFTPSIPGIGTTLNGTRMMGGLN